MEFKALELSLTECVATLQEMFDAGRRVYVHCSAGVERAPSVVVAYLHWLRNMELDDAVTFVKERRACSPRTEIIRRASRSLDTAD